MTLDVLTTNQLIIASFIIAIAYYARGIAGFGSGLISIPLLALMMPLHIVVPMIAILDVLASASHGVKNPQLIRWRDLLPLLPFSMVGVVLALYLFKQLDTLVLSKGLGVFIILYAVYSLVNLAPHKVRTRLWAIPAGYFAGLIGTLFGTGGPFYVIYFKLRGLSKADFRITIAVAFLLDGLVRISGFILSGFYDSDVLILIAVSLPIMATGMYLGGHTHATISQKSFQRGISILLIVSGVGLLSK